MLNSPGFFVKEANLFIVTVHERRHYIFYSVFESAHGGSHIRLVKRFVLCVHKNSVDISGPY